MQKLFPEFENLDNIEDLKLWPELQGHPRKIVRAFQEAIGSVDDGNLFIETMIALGEKHKTRLKDEYFVVRN